MADSGQVAALVRDQIIFAVLDEMSRKRALSPAESELMEVTMHRLENKRDYWQWSRDEDAQVRALIARRRQRKRRTKPFQANAEVAALAEALGRSFWSVQRRLERLRSRRKAVSSQMFKRANGHAVLDSGHGQARQTNGDASCQGRPACNGRSPRAEAGRPQAAR